MPLVLGVDSSTQATKVEVRDGDTGAVVGRGRAPHPPVQPPRAEQHPEDWWSALVDATHQALADVDARAVGAISVAGQQHGLVALDAAGAVLRPAKLWNDTESAPDAGWLLDQLGGAAAWADACGSVPVASFTITKLSWLHRSEPEVWSRLARVLLPHDWLTLRLCGEVVTDRGDASGTGYWSPREEAYRFDLLAVVDRERDWTSVVPRVLGPTEAAGGLRPAAAADLGLTAGIPVAAGTGDNMAAALGVALGPGDVAVSIGTSGTVYAVADRATADPSGAVAGFADATGRFLPLVCTLNAARVTDAAARLLGVGPEGLDALALAAPPGADGLVVVPYFDGERTPNRPDATGSVVGLRSDVTREAFARAAVEGVVCGLLDGLDALLAATGHALVATARAAESGRSTARAAESGRSTARAAESGRSTGEGPGRLLLVGGGARSAAYRRVLADLSGRVVTVPDGEEHVAAGAAVQAAVVHHGVDPIEVAHTWAGGAARVVEPDPAVDSTGVRQAYATARG